VTWLRDERRLCKNGGFWENKGMWTQAFLALYTFSLKGSRKNLVSLVEICHVHLFNWIGRMISRECETFLLQAFCKNQRVVVLRNDRKSPELRKLINELESLCPHQKGPPSSLSAPLRPTLYPKQDLCFISGQGTSVGTLWVLRNFHPHKGRQFWFYNRPFFPILSQESPSNITSNLRFQWCSLISWILI
jgi:hypothetical protein